jgi:hypothetical protein
MPARKLPSSVLEARGSFAHDPQRKRVDPISQGDLGKAPAYFTEEEAIVWDELKSIIPEGLAKNADRWICEIAARFMFKFRTTGLKSPELGKLIDALGRLGLSPSDRSKCAAPVAPNPNNEFREF